MSESRVACLRRHSSRHLRGSENVIASLLGVEAGRLPWSILRKGFRGFGFRARHETLRKALLAPEELQAG